MLSSSPQSAAHALRPPHGLSGARLEVPSSPTLAYHDGEISPSFDASFASSMSISSQERQQPTPLPAHVRSHKASLPSSPVVAMDISPAPAPVAGPSASASSRGMLRAPAPRPPLFARPHSQPVVSTDSLSIDPAPPVSAPSNNGHPFLKSLFNAQKSAPPGQTTFAPVGPLSVSRPASPTAGGSASRSSLDAPSTKTTRLLPLRPNLTHYATVPPSESDKLRPPFAKTAFEYRASSDGLDGQTVIPPPRRLDISARSVSQGSASGSTSRGILQPSWSKPQRQTAPAGQLAPPQIAPVKRHSDPMLPKARQAPESSPFRMEVDGESPAPGLRSPIALRPPGQHRSVSDSAASPSANRLLVADDVDSSPGSEGDRSGASDRLADMFGCSPGDHLSPIPQSRKRVLEQENSPTPAAASPTASILGTLGGPTRRPFEKSATTTSLGALRVRRQRSAVGLNSRPVLTAFESIAPPATAAVESFSMFNTAKRQATQALDGKPAPAPPLLRPSRRSNSVADSSFLGSSSSGSSSSGSGGPKFRDSMPGVLGTRDTNIPNESPRHLGPRTSISAMDPNYLCANSAARKAAAGLSPEAGSPIAGFRQQEAKGKALPCHGVKEDGLMRISPKTLHELQSGMYREGIKEFLIIDCRFDYEYEGGHIQGAINLSELADIEGRLLNGPSPPEPSTSETPGPEGKTVLIFHCEFSAKRAPTSAKHLRNQDRLRNVAAYPNIYYPEVYILKGGYEAFYRSYPERCVGGYVVMDNPDHCVKRSLNLNKFRDQKRQFNRASSFTFGQAQHASMMLRTAEATGAAAAANGYGRSRRPVSSSAYSQKPLELPGFEFPIASKKSSLAAAPRDGNSTAVTPSAVAASTAGLSITEEDHEGDSSFGTNGSSPGGPAGGSPCPPSSKMGTRPSLKLGSGGTALFQRKGLERAATSSVLTFSRR
ncbi:hypothetical protein JCM8115_005279 [Rhodotorula mucilaginosa]